MRSNSKVKPGLLRALTVFFMTTFFISPVSAQNDSPSNLLLILDASGSMWQKVEGDFKIAVARRVLKDLLGELPGNAQVGLIAYGHRKKADCADIETIAPLGALDKTALGQKIDAIDPKGKTPITDAVKTAFESVRSRAEETTIVVVSDGLETCGGAPCTTVEEAKKAGIKFVMHVIGFDLGKENVSELECAAQAGGGLYLSANNADELADALKKTTVADIRPGRLSVKATVHGKLEDALVRVYETGTKKEVAGGRTYASPKTNPRIMPVQDGNYDIEVVAIRLKGDVRQTLKNVEVKGDEIVEKAVDFTPGELSIRVTRNGNLSDATVNVNKIGERRNVAGGRTYTSANHNPKTFKISPGTYNVTIKSVEISGGIEHRFEDIVIDGGAKTELQHDFPSGTLKIGAVFGTELVDATVNVVDAETNKPMAGGRTYTAATSNPRTYELLPGKYRVQIKAVKLNGNPRREVELNVEKLKVTTHVVDFSK